MSLISVILHTADVKINTDAEWVVRSAFPDFAGPRWVDHSAEH
jgi:hypothetical protein